MPHIRRKVKENRYGIIIPHKKIEQIKTHRVVGINYSAFGCGAGTGATGFFFMCGLRPLRIIGFLDALNSSTVTQPSLFSSIFGAISAIFGQVATIQPSLNSGRGIIGLPLQPSICAATKPNEKIIKNKINFLTKPPLWQHFPAHAHPLVQPHGCVSTTTSLTTGAAFFVATFLVAVFFTVGFFVVFFSAICPFLLFCLTMQLYSIKKWL